MLNGPEGVCSLKMLLQQYLGEAMKAKTRNLVARMERSKCVGEREAHGDCLEMQRERERGSEHGTNTCG